MSLLDEIRDRILGRGLAVENDPIAQMAAIEPPPTHQLDPQVLEATGADMQQPGELGAGSAGGHPDVLSFVKELEQKGAFAERSIEKPKGMSAAQTTAKTEFGGPSAEERATYTAEQGQADINDAGVDAASMLRQSDELRKRALDIQMRASVEDDARKREEQENADRQTRLREQQEDLASQNDEPINPDRYMENKSLAAKGFALISAGIYGFLGGRGQPPVVETLMQMAKEDVQAQIQNNAQKRDKRDALIDQYERQYGDSTLVAKRLEADKLLTFAKKAQAEALEAKSDELKGSAEDLAKKLRNQVGRLHSEIQKATWEKPVEVTTTFKPTGKGGSDMAAKLERAAKLNKSLADSGATPEERQAMLKAANLPPISGQTMDEKKLDADQAEKARKAAEIPPTERQKLIERVDGLAEAKHGFDELDKAARVRRDKDGELVGAESVYNVDEAVPSIGQQAYETFSGLIPGKPGERLTALAQSSAGEDTKALRRAADKIAMGMAHAESGAGVNEAEAQRYLNRLATTSAATFGRSSAEVFREQRQKYNNLVGQYGKEAVDEMLRKRGIDPSSYGDGS